MTKKITKKDVLNAVRTLVNEDTVVNLDADTVVTGDDVINYIDVTIEQMEKKNERANARAAEKRAEGDELRNAVEATLSDEPIVINDIFDKVSDIEGVTKGKIVARLTQLVKAGKAHKVALKNEEGKQIMSYLAGPAPVEVEE